VLGFRSIARRPQGLFRRGSAKTLAGFTTAEKWQEAFNRRFAEAE
jgi:hypothetical protein